MYDTLTRSVKAMPEEVAQDLHAQVRYAAPLLRHIPIYTYTYTIYM